jgi:hypothetical protein
VKTKSRIELMHMYEALKHLDKARSAIMVANEQMLAGRIGSLKNELEFELEKWEVVACGPAYTRK